MLKILLCLSAVALTAVKLSRYHGDDPKALSRIQRFRNRQKNNIVKVKHATDEELSKYPPKGPGDKRIMDEAVKTDSRIIVTMDKLFRKRVNKEEMRKNMEYGQWIQRSTYAQRREIKKASMTF